MKKFSDLDKHDATARQSEALARRSLNALAVTSSIVNALVQYPGSASDHESMVEAAKTMLAQADEMAKRLESRLELDSIPWAKYRLLRMTTQAVSNRWIASSRQDDKPSADISAFLPVWREMAKNDLPSFKFDEPSEDERVMMQVCVLDAMQPVLQEIAVFDLFHNPVTAAMHAREQIVQAANEVLAELLPPDASRRAHAQLLEALLRNGGSIYASNWRRFSEHVVDLLQPMSVKQQENEVALHPGGWSLNEIDSGFLNTFYKLSDMVAFLANPSDETPKVKLEEQSIRAKTEQNKLHSEEIMDSDPILSMVKILSSEDQFIDNKKVNITENIFDISEAEPDDSDSDEAPNWDDEGPDISIDEGYASTAFMTEPENAQRSEGELDKISDPSCR